MTTPTPAAPTPAQVVTDEDGKALPTGWRGPVLPVNTRSGDSGGIRRMVVLNGDTVPARPLPVAFMGQETSEDGHDGARVIGVITRVWLDGGFVWAEGPFDLGDAFAREWARKLRDGFAGWVSVDLTDAQVTEVPLGPDGEPITDDMIAEWERRMLEWETDPGDDSPPPEPPEVAETLLEITGWKIGGATLVSVPAFEDARVAPVFEEFEPIAAVPALVAAAEAEADQTGAMIALVPADPDMLAVDGGEPVDELHLTLAYLGEADQWSEDARAALATALDGITGSGVDGQVFGWAAFNPASDSACAVYLVESPSVVELRAAVMDVLAATPGLPPLPPQHPSFIPHVTAGYGTDIAALKYTGPILFDRLRLSFGGTVEDTPLDTQALAASAGVQYPAAAFFQPEPDHYVDHWQVTDDGRVSMHLAPWDTCHIGYGDRCVTPPRGGDYSRFHRILVTTDDGPVKVGKITMDTGHAAATLNAAAATAHYDDTGTLVAVVRCTDGKLGPWLSGHLVPWASPEQAAKLAHHEVSGDWRGPTRDRLELVAALAVNVPGFMRSTVTADGAALVAAGRRTGDAPGLAQRLRQAHQRARKASTRRPAFVTEADIVRTVRAALAEFAEHREIEERAAPIDAKIRAAAVARLDQRIGYQR